MNVNKFNIIIGRTSEEVEILHRAMNRGKVYPYKTIQARSPLDLWGQILKYRELGHIRVSGLTAEDQTVFLQWEDRMRSLVGDVVMRSL